MSITFPGETLITLGKARLQFPSRPHLATVYRWTSRGIDGVLLETLSIDGRRFTSVEACQRFVAACNAETPAADQPAAATIKRRGQRAAGKKGKRTGP